VLGNLRQLIEIFTQLPLLAQQGAYPVGTAQGTGTAKNVEFKPTEIRR
jgi:hypothetical protein